MGSRVTRATNALPDYAPYLVTIRDADTQIHICVGSIINAFFVLTAAHCLVRLGRDGSEKRSLYYVKKASELRIVAGRYNVQWGQDTEQLRGIANNFVPSTFNRYDLANDIGLVKVSHPFKFNAYVKPIPMPFSNRQFTGSVSIYGYGVSQHSPGDIYESPETSQRSDLEIITNEECTGLLANRSSKVARFMMCAYSEHSSVCSGDSGSPVVCRDEFQSNLPESFQISRDILCGVVSWGHDKCIVNFSNKSTDTPAPSIFSRVSYFYGFIAKTIRKTETPSHFLCHNLQYVYKSQVCDFYRDCDDGSDESGCREKESTTVLPSNLSVLTSQATNFGGIVGLIYISIVLLKLIGM
ncbi:chymotrypsinogen 2-like [Folsomia candida]|uniref:chymotrypsinogen 2-like n=1 Tax=Folsomia candida TaxID=158441 RepID=UPI001604BCB1|nr:chymotrypsinogen 2-like [Folsomia candida]